MSKAPLTKAEIRRRRKRNAIIVRCVLGLILILLIYLVVFLITQKLLPIIKGQNETTAATTLAIPESSTEETTEAQNVVGDRKDELLAQADLLAAGYDYDAAIDLLKSFDDYENYPDMKEAVAGYEGQKAACVPVDVTKVPHIFYHSLINDPDRVFDGDSDEHGYNVYMTTIEEFDKITQTMYDEGYVFVRLRDLVIETKDENGDVHYEPNNQLMLPAGKKAVVISVDDLSYYHYMDDDGFPKKLVVDANGKVKCLVVKDDGTELIGDFDVVPRLNSFLEEHPDGAYKGARGLIAMTGYDGVFGYRTDSDYRDRLALQADQQEWLDRHPDFDFDAEVEQAKIVAEAIKESGWEFASHTWGHINVTNADLDRIMRDHEKWKENVENIVGHTDTIIFAFGADIGSWTNYTADNEKYTYLRGQGFHFFCNVDSSPFWVQITDDYVRQGRRNLDGYLMYKSMTVDNNLEDLFHVEDVFDPVRPTPISYE